MYKLCKTERSAKRQRLIERALLELMTEYPFDEISITQLCEKLDMPRKAFDRYFDGKEGALQALLEHTILEYEGFMHDTSVVQSSRRSMQEELEKLFLFVKQQKPLLDALRASNLLDKLAPAATSRAVHDMVPLSQLLPEEPDFVRVEIYDFAANGLVAMIVKWHQENFEKTSAEMATLAVRMLATPLLPITSAE